MMINTRTMADLLRITGDYDQLVSDLGVVAALCQKHGLPAFAYFGKNPIWSASEIVNVEAVTDMLVVEYMAWFGDTTECITVRIPIAWLGVADPEMLIMMYCAKRIEAAKIDAAIAQQRVNAANEAEERKKLAELQEKYGKE